MKIFTPDLKNKTLFSTHFMILHNFCFLFLNWRQVVIVPFHKDFSPSVEQLEHSKLAHNSPLTVVKQYFTNIAAIQNVSVLQQIWLYEIIGDTLPMCQNTTMRVNGAWIKRYCVLCSKTYNTLHSCHNFPAGLQQAARDARICETSLLSASTANT